MFSQSFVGGLVDYAQKNGFFLHVKVESERLSLLSIKFATDVCFSGFKGVFRLTFELTYLLKATSVFNNQSVFIVLLNQIKCIYENVYLVFENIELFVQT